MFPLFAACGTTAGGGGAVNQQVGGAPDSACNPDVHNQGCFAGKKVQCDATKKTWTDLAPCASGEYCAEVADPGDNTGLKKIAECKKQAVVQPDAGGTDAGTTDGGGTTTKTPAEIATCLQQKCATEYAACQAVPSCKAAYDCGAKCADEACQDKCPSVSMDDEAATAALFGLFGCGQKQACLPDPNKPTCGDGKCDAGETPDTCAADCKKTGPVCGNGACEAGETPQTCAADCKPDGPKCGNEKCEEGESAATCPSDCKPDGPKCGDGKCEEGESTATCPSDCKPDGPKCGNEKCEEGETPATCPSDCQQASTLCGDGKCTSPENSKTCTIDCHEMYSETIPCAMSKCASQYAACKAAKGCLEAINCAAKCLVDDQGSTCSNKCIEAAGAGAGAAITLVTCAEPCMPGSSTPECSSSKPCASGKKCVEGKCVTDTQPECSSMKPCADGKKCVEGKCVTDGGGAQCGDGKCEGNEKSTCPSDCGNVSGSCKGKCGKFESGAKCQCDDQCKQYKDCCSDYDQLCKAP